jgi:hypothetical protein
LNAGTGHIAMKTDKDISDEVSYSMRFAIKPELGNRILTLMQNKNWNKMLFILNKDLT